MPQKYTFTINDPEATTETFEVDPKWIVTESTENGERITVHDGDPDDLLLEAFVPNGTPYTIRKRD